MGAFKRGATAEEIVQDYPPVSLADVYTVIAYYLRHRSEVEEYLAKRKLAHEELRREIEGRPDHQELRAASRPNGAHQGRLEVTLRLAADENFDGRIVRGLLPLTAS